jgi:hypothetical protein
MSYMSRWPESFSGKKSTLARSNTVKIYNLTELRKPAFHNDSSETTQLKLFQLFPAPAQSHAV